MDLLNAATALLLDAAQCLAGSPILVELFGPGGGVAALVQNLKHLKYRDPVRNQLLRRFNFYETKKKPVQCVCFFFSVSLHVAE